MAKNARSAGANQALPLPAEIPDYKDEAQLSDCILKTVRKANRPVRMDELLRITHLPRKAKKSVEAALHTLQAGGQIVRASGGWAAGGRLRHIEGLLSVLPSGVGFVSPAQGGADVYIHPAAMNDAWHGDRVEVLLLPGKRGPSAEGRVSRVLRRSLAEIPAHALRRQKDGLWMCAPANSRLQALFLTDAGALEKELAKGDLLLLQPGEKLGPGLWQAKATLNLEHEESPAAQERITKSNHGIPGPFPEEALAEARALPCEPQEEDFAQRRDLRAIPFVTIDGQKARDFDDAIHVQADAKGFLLRVAIADVSHYVRPDSALDREARLRGNSCYFPLSVEPMLPEALSNGLCSLKPGTPRLVMAADLRFTAAGERCGADLYPAVIQSRARLTYGQIQRGLLLHDEEEAARLGDALPMLREAERLARLLLEQRRERGALDFDLPEAVHLFDEQGELCGVAARERHFGHRIIEECMIAANEAVAEFLEARQAPALYRVHQPPDPDKLRSLMDFLARSGLGEPALPQTVAFGPGKRSPAGKGKQGRVKKPPTSRDLRRILEQNKDTPGEYVITRLLLRAMMQARYQPENEGHFGLASACYCHFTSPIRRYADLLVHRALKRSLAPSGPEKEKAPSQARLEAAAEHINATERTAAEAEREMHKRLSVLFLRDRQGESFTALISGLTDFGIFVELPELLAEGMIRLSALDDDYYDYLEERQEVRGRRSGRSFRLGRSLQVRLTDVNLSRLELNFIPEGPVGGPTSGRLQKAPRSARTEKRSIAAPGGKARSPKGGGRKKKS